MAGYSYPPPAPTSTTDVRTIHRLLQSPPTIARRLRTLLEQRYIADALLKQRLTAIGGGIFYESGEPVTSGEAPRAIAPGGEYPLVQLGGGAESFAKTTKWGQDAEVFDEAIARLRRSPVDRGFSKLANQSVATVDGLAMSAIASAISVTTVIGAALASATAEQILTAFLKAKAQIIALNEGYMPDTVALDDVSHAIVTAKFVAAGYFPRETLGQNPAMTGDFPNYAGMIWLATPNAVTNTALVVDSEQLGGMGDEDLQSPGYSKLDGMAVEVKSTRLEGSDDRDGYRLRARRVTTPVILESGAGRKVDLTQ